jgi:hypothetical protein
MPAFLEKKLKSAAKKKGLKGNKITAKGKAMEKKHKAKYSRVTKKKLST